MPTDQKINFDDLLPKEYPFTLKGVKYVLREASGDAACKWRNSLLKATKLGPDGRPVSVEGMADSEPLLVSLCLYKADENGQIKLGKDGEPDPNTLVPIATVRKFPNRLMKQLFEMARDMSELGEKDTEETLVEKMDDLKERLASVRSKAGKNGQGEDDPSKNELYATTDTSS